MVKKRKKTFYEVLTEAVNYYIDNGWDSEKSLLAWSNKLRLAARQETRKEDTCRLHLKAIYRRLVIDGGALREQPVDGPSRITLSHIRPSLRKELDRRLFMAADLIRLNRETAIEKTLQRFQGWVSSVPPGGSHAVDRKAQKQHIRHSLLDQSYISRRVAIDQGHKLASNINYLISIQGGAIAFRWHSNWRRPGYAYRAEHKERDGLIYLVRGSWAVEQGLIKPVNGYYDAITAAGEEVYCSCKALPVYAPQKLPDEFLTDKGRKAFDRV